MIYSIGNDASIFIKKKIVNNRTIITIEVGGRFFILPSIEGTNVDIKLDKYYILIINNNDNTLYNAFNLKNMVLIDTNNNILKKNIENTYLIKEGFSLFTVLSVFYNNLIYTNIEDTNNFINYLTNGNDLPIEKVKEYILSVYPNIDKLIYISLVDLMKLMDVKLYFYKMPEVKKLLEPTLERKKRKC